MSYETPLKITIPIPNPIPLGRGNNSTGRRGGNLRVRCTNKEYDLVQEEAAVLGLGISPFSRWCVLHCAKALRKHRRGKESDIEAITGD